ncbi:MAG: D-2-hydroxyacid dehydrogenase [Desulfovibrio sp.]|jgi:glycerate dehydrogenase|nr:D-2-hydroxyacid dehydrogenase [Desulfovibrio sp.]
MSQLRIVFLDAGTIRRDIQWPDFTELGYVVSYDHTLAHETLERIRDAEVIFTNKVHITAEHIAAAKNLRYIGLMATGYNHVDGVAAAARGIPVCNVPDYSTEAVSQHTIALMLALQSNICWFIQSVRNGEWSKSTHFCYWDKPIVGMHGKTLGIVGFGNIGAAVAKIGHGFGMNILACNPRPKPAPDYAPFIFTNLVDLFRQADIVSLHCPLTPDTNGMVNAGLLRLMKKTAILINCSRGPLINEKDLLEALENGVIAGAALDVVVQEPMPDDYPLRFAPNCIITPHVAWCTSESRTKLMRMIFDNLKNFLKGRPVNVCNNA